ncbi:hypothetical protein [Bacillus cereus group sp. BfR-BA-01380]|uniref:hypothetical protein n=1 Tax=Bacillus cereus group sp. BfR-BA-01380 TaxID=2920324 RepID=UPI001F5A151C|nr:hypothetical protein [Bacillus cereus group sp. BfR-BA-01380]
MNCKSNNSLIFWGIPPKTILFNDITILPNKKYITKASLKDIDLGIIKYLYNNSPIIHPINTMGVP